MDALTHAVEGYTSHWANDFSDGLCVKAAQLIFDYLPRAYQSGADDPEAREKVHNAATIAGQLRDAFYGTKASEFQVGREAYEIDVRLRERDKASLRDLYDFRIITTSGHQVPVSAVAEIAETRGFARIQRIDGQRLLRSGIMAIKRKTRGNDIDAACGQLWTQTLGRKKPAGSDYKRAGSLRQG